MSPRLLIDGIVQQTMVLIAQLSTMAGFRSPLAHVADQVFLSLSQEIERQGVGRKVVADMFGLALRSYQRKVQRLTESQSLENRSLWEAVFEFLAEHGPTRKERILERFQRDDEPTVLAALSDLVSNGLAFSTGRGEATIYGVTTEAMRDELADAASADMAATLVWGIVFRSPGITEADLTRNGNGKLGAAEIRSALATLLADGRVTRPHDGEDAPLGAAPYVIPVGSREGWEAAVLDHFYAVANAIAAKAQALSSGATQDPRLGGSTIHFGIYPGHPFEAEVEACLTRIRADMNALWTRVSEYNRDHPVPDETATRITVYFGQYVREPAEGRDPP